MTGPVFLLLVFAVAGVITLVVIPPEE